MNEANQRHDDASRIEAEIAVVVRVARAGQIRSMRDDGVATIEKAAVAALVVAVMAVLLRVAAMVVFVTQVMAWQQLIVHR